MELAEQINTFKYPRCLRIEIYLFFSLNEINQKLLFLSKGENKMIQGCVQFKNLQQRAYLNAENIRLSLTHGNKALFSIFLRKLVEQCVEITIRVPCRESIDTAVCNVFDFDILKEFTLGLPHKRLCIIVNCYVAIKDEKFLYHFLRGCPTIVFHRLEISLPKRTDKYPTRFRPLTVQFCTHARELLVNEVKWDSFHTGHAYEKLMKNPFYKGSYIEKIVIDNASLTDAKVLMTENLKEFTLSLGSIKWSPFYTVGCGTNLRVLKWGVSHIYYPAAVIDKNEVKWIQEVLKIMPNPIEHLAFGFYGSLNFDKIIAYLETLRVTDKVVKLFELQVMTDPRTFEYREANKHHSLQEIIDLKIHQSAEYTKVVVQKLEKDWIWDIGTSERNSEFQSIKYLAHHTAERAHFKLELVVAPDQIRYIEVLEYDSPNGLFKPIELKL
ncbi:hypothetical protein FGO68_gene15581 [Halteria grandinella]|uniref:Uncharacterized protein n=1 Tax=Halteria grandinella TaxID=5974 RepID=A0A8J8T1K3_HALGN|nr:hypothetical protein FGO68_gene15581 [Halteria grandinella]